MSKQKLGPWNILSPTLPVLVGTHVGGVPNYITIAMVGWLCYDTISVSVGRKQYSNAGIKENGTFSVNQPSTELVKELDSCGLYSGKAFNKAALFENFYGELETAPMIKECPVNIACNVIQTIERPVHTVFVGEVKEAYVEETIMSDGVPDYTKIDPILYVPIVGTKQHAGLYTRMGENLAEAWKVGKELKPEKKDQTE